MIRNYFTNYDISIKISQTITIIQISTPIVYYYTNNYTKFSTK